MQIKKLIRKLEAIYEVHGNVFVHMVEQDYQYDDKLFFTRAGGNGEDTKEELHEEIVLY